MAIGLARFLFGVFLAALFFAFGLTGWLMGAHGIGGVTELGLDTYVDLFERLDRDSWLLLSAIGALSGFLLGGWMEGRIFVFFVGGVTLVCAVGLHAIVIASDGNGSIAEAAKAAQSGWARWLVVPFRYTGLLVPGMMFGHGAHRFAVEDRARFEFEMILWVWAAAYIVWALPNAGGALGYV